MQIKCKQKSKVNRILITVRQIWISRETNLIRHYKRSIKGPIVARSHQKIDRNVTTLINIHVGISRTHSISFYTQSSSRGYKSRNKVAPPTSLLRVVVSLLQTDVTKTWL